MDKSSFPGAGNPWFGVSMVLIGVIIGYGVAVGVGGSPAKTGAPAAKEAPANPQPAPQPQPAADVPPVDPDTDHIKGDPDATISVIEYSDFECPFCKRHHPTMKQLVDEVDDVNWVYRHYPLGFHPNAQKAAEASECAGEQGKFWEYADILIEKGPDNTQLVAYAEELKLNKSKFESCLEDGKYTQKIKDQMNAGAAAGIRGTPGNIVYNNKTKESQIVSGAQQIDAFKTAIENVK